MTAKDTQTLKDLAAWIRTPGNINPDDAIDEIARLLENNGTVPLAPPSSPAPDVEQAREALKDYICRWCAAGITAEVSGLVSALIAAAERRGREQMEERAKRAEQAYVEDTRAFQTSRSRRC